MCQNNSYPRQEIQALWCGINIPAQAKEGLYSGIATIKAKIRLLKPYASNLQ
nr:glycoside hydrolase domain-containing protein [Paraflavitalea speifideiaquila]